MGLKDLEKKILTDFHNQDCAQHHTNTAQRHIRFQNTRICYVSEMRHYQYLKSVFLFHKDGSTQFLYIKPIPICTIAQLFSSLNHKSLYTSQNSIQLANHTNQFSTNNNQIQQNININQNYSTY